MSTRDIIKPIARSLPQVTVPRAWSAALPAALFSLGLFRPRRRGPPVFAIAAGAAVAAAAVTALLIPSSRSRFKSLLEGAGGGIGKQFGRLLGEQAGAHPLKTANFVREARDLVGSGEHPS